MADQERPEPRSGPRRSGRPADRPRTLARYVQAGPEGPRQARAHVRAALARWHVDQTVTETATLVASEIVTHAVLHSGAVPGRAAVERVRCQVEHWQRGVVRVTVEGPPCSCLPGPRPAASAEGGGDPVRDLREYARGLEVVVALSDAWGARQTDTGQTVWAQL
ncbi:ATP-binding protein [Streptomyces sp. NPDC005955]|uniref:ATP-binding protein n=1 Tax=Streptomyces sp. NPDC005955 TaxID=3364738 RepID=UPI0036976B3E